MNSHVPNITTAKEALLTRWGDRRLRTVLGAFAGLALLGSEQVAHGEGTPESPSAATARAYDGYVLRWSDEFDEDGPPSRRNWSFERGFQRNEEAQWYQPDNAFCEDGLLVIEGRRERIAIDPAEQGNRAAWARSRTHAEYTSSSLHTRGKHDWLYGRFVMRAKIPAVEGAWPAFWTLGYGRWPACGEIDIMEYYDHSILANVGWLGAGGRTAWSTVKTPLRRLGDDSWSSSFHEWRMDWNRDRIDLYVDDQLLNSTPMTEIRNRNQAANNPMQRRHYLLVNLAIGGVNGGDPSGAPFPLRYEIDYVRVYQRSPQSPTPAE